MYGYFASRDHILQALRQRWVKELAAAVASPLASARQAVGFRRGASGWCQNHACYLRNMLEQPTRFCLFWPGPKHGGTA